MRAVRAEREDLRAASRQQDGLVADLAEQHGAIGELRESDALGEIGSLRLPLSFGPPPIEQPVRK
jgi:hypothetical protein